MLADGPEQIGTASLDVFCDQNAWMPGGDPLEDPLSLEQRVIAEIATSKPEAIEYVERRRSAPPLEVIEVRAAGLVEAHDLPVENSPASEIPQ